MLRARRAESDSRAEREYHRVRGFQTSADADQAPCCRFLQGVDRDLLAARARFCLTQRVLSREQAETSTHLTCIWSMTMKIDPRGPRFGAVITSVVLAIVLVTASGWLLFAQTLVFAIGALAGLRYAPYGLLYRHLVQPRLGPPSRTEAEAPPRFAQGVGMVTAGIGSIGFAAGSATAGMAFAALALAAAFLNAAFGLCLGCQMYLLIQRIRPAE